MEQAGRLRYGAREIPVTFRSDSAPRGSGESMTDPAIVQIDSRLIDDLCMYTEPVYRLLLQGDVVEVGPVLGLLLGNRNHWYAHDYLHREPERVTGVYPRTGGLFCAFSPRNLSLVDGRAYGLMYDPDRDRWRFGALPVPSILHRRSFHNMAAAVERVREVPGLTLFNSRRYDKWELYEILRRDESCLPHLPETVQAGAAAVFELADRHDGVILKPADLSRGRGILFVHRARKGYVVSDYRRAGEARWTQFSREGLDAFLTGEVLTRPYLCQQKLDLATIQGSPYDIRVVMQRRPDGSWGCTGIECRLAGSGSLVTNIAFGGRALLLHEAVRASFGDAIDFADAEARVLSLAYRVCRRMDETGEHFGEFGLDLAFDRSGRVWFIEANVLPTFRGFRTLDMAVYRQILAAPLLYAGALAGFGAAPGEGEDHAGL